MTGGQQIPTDVGGPSQGTRSRANQPMETQETSATQATSPEKVFFEDNPFTTAAMTSLVMSIQEIQDDKTCTGDQLKAVLVEYIPFERMFNDEAVYFTTFCNKLGQFLRNRDIPIPPQYRFKPMEGISREIYNRDPPRYGSFSQNQPTRQHPASGSSTTAGQASRMSPANESYDLARISNNIAGRFRDKEKRFSGGILENLQEFFDDYKSVCQVNGVESSDDMIKFLPIALEGDAKRFFHNNQAAQRFRNFNELRTLFEKEYNSKTNQVRVKDYLCNLSFDAHLAKAPDATTALKKIYQKIQRLHPQVPKQYRAEWHMIEILRGIVKKYPWSRIPRNTSDNSEDPSFNKFYQDLLGELQVDSDVTDDLQSSAPRAIRNFYVGQRRYGKPAANPEPRRFGNKFQNKAQPGIKCWNCQKFGHTARQCNEKVSHDVPMKVLLQACEEMPPQDSETEEPIPTEDETVGCGNDQEQEEMLQEEEMASDDILYIPYDKALELAWEEEYPNEVFDSGRK